MSIFKQFQTNTSKENEGIWIDYAANDDGTIPSFKIARIGVSNKKWNLVSEKLTKPYRRQIELGTLGKEKAEELFITIFCESILLDWRNVQSATGETIPYSKEMAITVLKQLPDLYKDLQNQANDRALFLEANLEADSKN